MAKFENLSQKNTAYSLRTINRRLENAYKSLGANSTTVNNLISEIKSTFGENAIRTNKEGIPQVKTGKETLNTISQAQAKAVKESTKEYTQEVSKRARELKNKLKTMGKRGTQNQIKQLETIESTISEVFDLYKTAQEAGASTDELSGFLEFADDYNNRTPDDFDSLKKLSKTAEKIIKYERKKRAEQQNEINEFEETDLTEDILNKYR